MKKRYTEEQIIGFFKQVEAGMAVKELCRKHEFSEASFYVWHSKFGGVDKEALRKTMATAPARRELVRWIKRRGCLRLGQMSPSALRYQPRPDHNMQLRQRIVELA